ncbi:hypothetical protein BMERY_1852 [Bifidobacterium merycicum]|uniref:Uncharacterized protein n=1 Tax=Bifidobacterium merycicum TaxID=78345 RepID=A0A087BED2_9BIFI|nr:hypothetical protein BMERY_1852 [Bifidobacterium merycicum]
MGMDPPAVCAIRGGLPTGDARRRHLSVLAVLPVPSALGSSTCAGWVEASNGLGSVVFHGSASGAVCAGAGAGSAAAGVAGMVCSGSGVAGMVGMVGTAGMVGI